MAEEFKMSIVKVPMMDTGLGREAGFRDDAELVEAGKAQRAELEKLINPDVLAAFDAAEEAATRRFLLGDQPD